MTFKVFEVIGAVAIALGAAIMACYYGLHVLFALPSTDWLSNHYLAMGTFSLIFILSFAVVFAICWKFISRN